MLTDLAQKLRAYTAPDGSKLTIVECPGWQSRGYLGQSLYAVKGHLFHHTASNQSSGLDAVTLRMCIGGRSDLPGPLCHLLLGRSGTVYVVAAGLANHAGRGYAPGLPQDAGNYYLIGTEMESCGLVDDWTEAQRRVMPHLGAAIEQGYSGGDRSFIQTAHREYSSEGKIDPSFIDMDKLRGDINSLLDGVDRNNKPAPKPAPVKPAPVKPVDRSPKYVATDPALTQKVKNYKTGGETTLETEVGWLPQNFAVIFEQLDRIEKKLGK